MFIHPSFDPVAVQLGPLAIRWYALSYIVGFILFVWLGRKRIRAGNTVFTNEMLDDLLTWGVVGVILGGRLGYILFYNLDAYLANPLNMFKVWEGGMAFHGGFLGVLCAVFLFAKKRDLRFFQVLDFVAPLVATGLASGRIGNFINGELWGRVTHPNNFWATGFPQARDADIALAASNPQYAEWFAQFGYLPRHPSQLYQFALEGMALFAIVWLFSKTPRPEGQVSAAFLGGYGIFRFIAEYARQPDAHLDLFMGLSRGQWLSTPMIALGIIGFIYFGRKKQPAH